MSCSSESCLWNESLQGPWDKGAYINDVWFFVGRGCQKCLKKSDIIYTWSLSLVIMGDDIGLDSVCFDFHHSAAQCSWVCRQTTIDDNLSLNPKICHHTLITQLSFVKHIQLILKSVLLIWILIVLKKEWVFARALSLPFKVSWVINGWWHWIGSSDRLSPMVVRQP